MNDPTLHLDYHTGLASLEGLLRGLEQPGDFATGGTVELPLPRVEVDGVGVLAFPLLEVQARALIAVAERAPYGRGTETILDTSVRRVWQLAPGKVRLGGKSWPATFESILALAAEGLGVARSSVDAELYKLLVYDPGSFFKGHRDTEKAEGMFGTLVVSLPSIHQGGELVVRHEGREVTVDASQADVAELSFAAFYADCEHEVRPIITGHRISLVYNLVRNSSKAGGRGMLAAPARAGPIADAAAMLKEAMARSDAPMKLVWLLEHQYTPAGLAFAGLKGKDDALVRILAPAASEAGCEAHLAMFHIEESGSAELEYGGYHRLPYRRRGGWGPRPASDVSGTPYQIIEVHELSQHLDGWVDLGDRPVAFGSIPLEPGELLPQGALDGEKPDVDRVTEATGNEGASFERSYLRAALVIWQREKRGDILLQAGPGAAMGHLERLVQEASRAGAPAEAREEAASFAARAIASWERSRRAYRQRVYLREGEIGPPARNDFLGMLTRLGEASLLERFMDEVLPQEYDGTENPALLTSARVLGPERTGAHFARLLEAQMPHEPRGCVSLLAGLLEARGVSGRAAGDPEWLEALRGAAAGLVAGLKTMGEHQASHAWADRWSRPRKSDAVDGALVADLADSLERIASEALSEAAATALVAQTATFDPGTVLVPALALLEERHGAALASHEIAWRLWEHAASFLLARSEEPPAAPTDWKQEPQLRCRCELCRELEAFALDPRAVSHRVHERESSRQHVIEMLGNPGLDMIHRTVRQGSPYTLVVTKTRRGHERRCEQHRGDVEAMKALARIAVAIRKDLGGGDGAWAGLEALAGRLAGAISRAPAPPSQ